MKRSVAYWGWLIPLILAAVWFGARGLDIDPIKQDEFFQIRDVRTTNDPLAMAVHVAAANPWHVPAYFILLNAWGRFFAWNPVPMRAFALLIGVLTIAWTYQLGRLVSRRVGLYAAAVMAASAFFIFYWHEVRMYTMTAMMAALTLWLYLRLIQPERAPSQWEYVALALSAAVALYTHYFLGLLLAPLGVYHVLFAPKGRRWWYVTAALGAGALLFAPWTSVFFKITSRMEPGDIGKVLENGDVVRHIAKVFGNGQIWLLPVFGLLGLLAVRFSRGRARRVLLTIWFLFGASVALVLTANSLIGLLPADRMRYVVYLWPLMAVIVAAGMVALDSLIPRRLKAGAVLSSAAVIAWVLLGFWGNWHIFSTPNFLDYLPYFPVQRVFREVRPLHRPGDYIVHVLPDYDWPDRYRRSVPFYPEIERLAADSGVIGWLSEPERQTEQYRTILQNIGAGRQYVWVAYPPGHAPSSLPEFERALSRRYAMCGVVVTRPDFLVSEYAPSPVCCTPESGERPALALYGDSVQLMGVDLRVDGRMLRWHMAFQHGDSLPAGLYSVAVHIINDAGELVAQSDSGLPGETFQCEQRELSLDGLPPGEYEVRLGVYNWQTGERLPGALTDSGQQGDLLPVGAFTLRDDV